MGFAIFLVLVAVIVGLLHLNMRVTDERIAKDAILNVLGENLDGMTCEEIMDGEIKYSLSSSLHDPKKFRRLLDKMCWRGELRYDENRSRYLVILISDH